MEKIYEWMIQDCIKGILFNDLKKYTENKNPSEVRHINIKLNNLSAKISEVANDVYAIVCEIEKWKN